MVYKSNTSLRSFTDAIRLNLPRYNMNSYGLRSFSVCGPKLWNELPSELRAIDSILSIFKVARLDFLGAIPPKFEH